MLEKQQPSKHWIIMAAGTGGHVIPALSVAKALSDKGYTVSFLGSPAGIEQRLVPAQGFELDVIPMQGIRGNGLLRWVFLPFLLLRAVYHAWGIFRLRRPMAVLGMGGFVTVPGGIAACLSQIPLIIHEQNAVPGWANRGLKYLARRVLVAFPNTFADEPKVHYVGNPLREGLCEVPLPRLPTLPLKILVVGGSLGAKALNDAIAGVLIKHPSLAIEVMHQTGERGFPEISHLYKSNNILNVEVMPFIQDMLAAYAWADLVICRAGAMTIAELAAVGRASILVPYPHAVDDHQTANAALLTEANAAFLLPNAEISVHRLVEMIQFLLSDPEQVIQMGLIAKQLAKPHATEAVVEGCLEVCRES